MKHNFRRLIPAILAALVVLPVCLGFFAGSVFSDSAKEADIASYYEKLTGCIEQDLNPLADEEIIRLLKQRFSEFKLTQDEAQAIIATLNNEQVDSEYRNLYLLCVYDYECNTKENHATSYYSADDNTVHIGKNVAPNNFLATFFHESGHAIQISLWDREADYEDKAETFAFPAEQDIYDAVVQDVKQMIGECVDELSGTREASYSPEQKKLIADAFVNADQDIIREDASGDPAAYRDVHPSVTGDEALSEAYRYVRERIENSLEEIPNSNASMVSDVYGGVTNNKIIGNMGHPSRKENPDGTVFCYWYDDDGNTTYNQLTEAWAEFFSAMVSGDSYNIEQNMLYFPNAVTVLDTLEMQLYGYYLENAEMVWNQ